MSANKYFRIAGEQGNAWGQWFLAESLMSDGLESEAIWVFEMAARAEHKPSMSKLCRIYRDANDAERARYWCRRAADNGDAAAAFELGLMARIAEDWEQAKYWYGIAAEQGDENAMCNLGFVYHTTGDAQQARYWYTQAAGAGDALAMYNLGCEYEDEGSFAIAREWYTKAAQHGNPHAAAALANISDR